MATAAQRTEIRLKLGEPIPEGGTDSDTLFSDVQVDNLVDKHGSVDEALGEGWQIKAGLLAGLVDVAEGGSKRNLSSLHQNALRMAEVYGFTEATAPGGQGHVRIRPLHRTGFQG
jgi:hypothetical protein